MRVSIAVPAVLYLALLDRMGDAWEYGRLDYPGALGHYSDTLALARELPSRVNPPRCAIVMQV